MGKENGKVAVIIGRFQSFHRGHGELLRKAAEISPNILVLVGSSFRPRTPKNWFTFRERRGFIEAAAEDMGIDADIGCLPLVDTLYDNDAWCNNVRTAVNLHKQNTGLDRDADVVIVGYEKDASSDYLNWFRSWGWQEAYIDAICDGGDVLNATDLRKAVMCNGAAGARMLAGTHGEANVERLLSWVDANPETMAYLKSEADYEDAYKAKVAEAEEIFGFAIPVNTADNVVTQNGNILLVTRKNAPGKDLYALPGGHIERDETSLEAAIRELRQETKLNMPAGAIKGRLKDRRIFDHPKRSARAWVRTEVFHFDLEGRAKPEKVKGGDDAKEAFWKPINELTPDMFFEDHFDIIQSMVPNVPFAYSSILMSAIH
ncbi:NUDIX domain-containing protein [Salipiger mucosus]|uniref:Nicotinamide-nucleotide adenylyltransferase n=1 Tax=Salipiger mucosus DSM 16094 TaxID=1123237 RepID=S9QEG6_9RHOB|nr:NUDIX domain-containing protein [Salipiger mucosus]EPX77968.1 nicotinamide-nucleotide adenylyltransferase [Salipiger mucosus DSM 16094]